jgi:hypothetical protein
MGRQVELSHEQAEELVQFESRLREIERHYAERVATTELWGVGVLRLTLLPTAFAIIIAARWALFGEQPTLEVLAWFGVAAGVSVGFHLLTWLAARVVLSWRTAR